MCVSYYTSLHNNKDNNKYKLTKYFYDGPDKNKAIGILKMGTMNLTKWTRTITGHNTLAYFQSKLDPTIEPTCRLCNEKIETAYHLLSDCDATYKDT